MKTVSVGNSRGTVANRMFELRSVIRTLILVLSFIDINIPLRLAIKFGKPWHVPSSYPAIRGTMYLNGITFANFGNECGNRNVAIRTNHAYEDMQMPIIASNISYINVETSHAIFYDNPSLG